MKSGNKKDDELVGKEFNHGLLAGYLIAQAAQLNFTLCLQRWQASEWTIAVVTECMFTHKEAVVSLPLSWNTGTFPVLLFENLSWFVTQQYNMWALNVSRQKNNCTAE